jgi:hypothetical protein
MDCDRCGKKNLNGAVKVWVGLFQREEWFCLSCFDEVMFQETRDKTHPKGFEGE